MSFVKVSEVLKIAEQANTSAIAFNCIDYNTVKSVIDVAEELGKPCIIMLYPQHCSEMHWTNLEGFAAMVRAEAEKVNVPISLHLDHSSDFDFILSAIKAGFPSVMYDGSMLTLEENIKNTKEVARAAHALGAEVEAELGRVGFANTLTDQSNMDMYTKPDVAASFCELSCCDSVAVAIGSAHGFYTEAPKLDLERLKEINAATEIPLVLHGGSGIPNDQLEVAFTYGVNKFNVGTEFLWLYKETIINFKGADVATLANEAQDALRAYLRKKLTLAKF